MKTSTQTKKELMYELELLRGRVAELEKREGVSGQDIETFGERTDGSFLQLSSQQEAIFVVFDRKLEFVNDRFAKLFGISPEEACKPDFDPLTLIAPESRRFICVQYNEACRNAFVTRKFTFTGLSKSGLRLSCETFVIIIPYKWGVALQGTLHSVFLGRRIDAALQSRSDLHFAWDATPA